MGSEMNEDTAKNLVCDVLEKPFDKARFTNLVRNILNRFDNKSFTYPERYIFDDFKDSIHWVERIGQYKDKDEKLIDIMVVHLKKETSLERARTKQRNYIAKYLKSSRGVVLKDAALVAFVAPNSDDWRFSFVKMEYKFNEQGKVREEFTPARRYSFLVGKNESSHTAQSCLLPVLLNDKTDPTLNELEQTFSVEKVTSEFFKKYKDLFIRLKESLDDIVHSNTKIKSDFSSKNIDTSDFAKKLLGQIVFLYFLQKKGWFGVKRGKPWGSGSKHFLRELMEKRQGEYQNFFNNVLEPLFYEALRSERTDDYYSRFNCRIPFLNGGLFDPLGDYDWVNMDILLPNELFSNKTTAKEGDTGNGILDVFDRYNFTVKEDEPLEKEVAVDPEMLGKVFENLLEIKDRKSKGTYYTPREIVHYMCQESLINYLVAEMRGGGGKVNNEDIVTLIQYGETSVEHDAIHIAKRSENANDKGRYSKSKLPQSIEKHACFIDEQLKRVRVCDPAVGSGAFVVSMMNEIVRARNTLTLYMSGSSGRSTYDFKRHAIQDCLYGVDIDAGAVEIAKLRLWLSLVVDEEEREKIKPLPNLDYKIVQGNSLLSVEKDLFNDESFKQLEVLKPLHFNETGASKKKAYKEQIDALVLDITDGHTGFDFRVYFSEIFHGEEAFDIVIGNPPYVQLQKDGGGLGKLYKDQGFTTFAKTGDIYQLFYERGLNLLTKAGLLCYITSNKWMRTNYGSKTRKLFAEKNPLLLLDLGSDAFDTATVDTNILLINNNSVGTPQLKAKTLSKEDNLTELTDKDFYPMSGLDERPWAIMSPQEQSIKEKIAKIGTPLKEWDIRIYRGVITGFNEAFIIDTHKRDVLIAQDPKSAEIIKPILRGRDVGRYGYKWAGKWIILAKYQSNQYLEQEYPIIYNHLSQYEEKLKQRGQCRYGGKGNQGQHHWLELDNNPGDAYLAEFEKEKIVYSEIVQEPQFYLDNKGYYVEATTFLMTGESIRFLLGILHSKIATYAFRSFYAGGGLGNSGYRYKKKFLEQLPIPKISESQQQPFIFLVNKILKAKAQDPRADTSDLEAKIDQLVYQLYNLTTKEIELIEES